MIHFFLGGGGGGVFAPPFGGGGGGVLAFPGGGGGVFPFPAAGGGGTFDADLGGWGVPFETGFEAYLGDVLEEGFLSFFLSTVLAYTLVSSFFSSWGFPFLCLPVSR